MEGGWRDEREKKEGANPQEKSPEKVSDKKVEREIERKMFRTLFPVAKWFFLLSSLREKREREKREREREREREATPSLTDKAFHRFGCGRYRGCENEEDRTSQPWSPQAEREKSNLARECRITSARTAHSHTVCYSPA